MTKNKKTTTEIEIHEINLESLYRYAPQFNVEKILESILKNYIGLEYKILVTISPDIGSKYFDKEFQEFVLNFHEDDIELAAIEYAKRHGYDLVTLFDGYEKSIALIREKNP
jgi:hypothetical protein